jgi:hypothetical protein
MGGDGLTIDDVRTMAADIGMTHLTDEHLEQLLRATKLAQARRSVITSAKLTPADEPAHVFRLGEDNR